MGENSNSRSRKYNWGLNLVIALFLSLLMLTHNVNGQGNNLYTCWGGCYNKCFLLSPGGADQYPCYFSCLSQCTYTQSLESYQYYCQIGCSATRCIPLRGSSSSGNLRNESFLNCYLVFFNPNSDSV